MASRAGVLRGRSGGQFFLEVQYYAILSATGAAHPAASGRTITPAAAVGPQAVLARLSSSTARSRSLAHIRGRGGFGVMGSSGSNADGAAAPVEPAAWAVAADGGLVGRRWFASQLPVLHSQEQDGPPDEFVDLRMDERASLFPEGLAGARQGMVASYLRRGVGHKLQAPPGSSNEMIHRDERPSPLLLMQRESSKAVINALDAFASGQDWGEVSPARQAPAAVDDGTAISGDCDKTGEATDDGVREGQQEISQLASKNTVYEAELERLGDQVPRRARRWRTLNMGKKWDKAQALAESKRKPLKPNRRVRVRPQQKSFLLTGARGVGKSCALNQIVLHARSTGWVVIFVPEAWDLLHRGIYCCPSPTFEGMFDLPKHSLKMLAALKTAHEHQLKELDIQNPEVLARHEGAVTLLDLVNRGVDNEEAAGTVHLDVVRELKASTEVKVLLAVDSYNEFFQPSMWHYMDDKLETPHFTATNPLVPAVEITPYGYAFSEAFDDGEEGGSFLEGGRRRYYTPEEGGRCLPTPPVNGMVVCATSGRYPPLTKYLKKKWAPFEEAAGRMIHGVSVPVEPLTREDMKHLLGHFVEDRIVRDHLTEEQVSKVHAKSNGLPERIYMTCARNCYN